MNTHISSTSRSLMTCKIAISCTINIGVSFAQCCIASAIGKNCVCILAHRNSTCRSISSEMISAISNESQKRDGPFFSRALQAREQVQLVVP